MTVVINTKYVESQHCYFLTHTQGLLLDLTDLYSLENVSPEIQTHGYLNTVHLCGFSHSKSNCTHIFSLFFCSQDGSFYRRKKHLK